ncbi:MULTISPECIES: DUF2515 family protein [Sorangium]|uniref:Uncharacterized protein n=1 Tax=Sorangium cellulosum TaxID=56 RepID=A0A4P2R170_SORCE|nr:MULTISPECIES: DUF2515 family protein [Sorangium]AUX36388.1 uncharacterized protein SOCE836_085950 [Sorangium cellulosum]WCQ95687.1 hypothetical protein NQZ70_08464 [Sorangium sp. Soce836]
MVETVCSEASGRIGTARLAALLDELDARNVDNVARTESYLELYALTRAHPPDLPWLLMAHLVSRNAGALMTEIAAALDRGDGAIAPSALRESFLFLERANHLIFFDAWYHVLHHLLGQSAELRPGRCSQFVRDAWARHEAARGAGQPHLALERALVRDLVTNEQNVIERRVVHHPRFSNARALLALAEALGQETPVVLPCARAPIRVGGFAFLDRRIAAGMRIYGAMADRAARDAMYEWARRHPHDGSWAPWGGPPRPRLREAWPAPAVRALWDGIHAPPEPDPGWP